MSISNVTDPIKNLSSECSKIYPCLFYSPQCWSPQHLGDLIDDEDDDVDYPDCFEDGDSANIPSGAAAIRNAGQTARNQIAVIL